MRIAKHLHRARFDSQKEQKEPWDFSIFRPRVGECPPELIHQESIHEDELDFIRVMKDDDRVIAAYKIHTIDSFTYMITWIQVSEPYRRMGIGGWLLAHAAGVIETRGGRSILVNSEPQPFLTRFGFVEVNEQELRYDMIQE